MLHILLMPLSQTKVAMQFEPIFRTSQVAFSKNGIFCTTIGLWRHVAYERKIGTSFLRPARAQFEELRMCAQVQEGLQRYRLGVFTCGILGPVHFQSADGGISSRHQDLRCYSPARSRNRHEAGRSESHRGVLDTAAADVLPALRPPSREHWH